MWNFIYRKFSGKNVARRNQGIKQLATFRFNKENILELINLVASTEIAAGTKTISIEELGVHMLLNCLPSRFHGVRSVLESKNEELNVNTVTSSLVAEEERQIARAKIESSSLCFTSAWLVPAEMYEAEQVSACRRI